MDRASNPKENTMSYTGNEISNHSHAIVTAIGDSVLGGCEDFRQTDEADGFVFTNPEGEGTIRRTITTPDPSWTVTLPDGRTATHVDPTTAINRAVLGSPEAEPSPLHRKVERDEHLAYTELRNAIKDAQALLIKTEAWATAWHNGESATPPFSVSGIVQAQPLTDLLSRAQAYRAAAETLATVSEHE
jgi:hypothetical protein